MHNNNDIVSSDYLQTISALDSQVTEISTVIFDSEHQYFLPYELFHLIFLPILLLSTLLMTHLVIPLFPGFRMKLKIGVGVVFTAISPTAAMIIQFTLGNIHAYPLKHLLWMILPILFLSIGHMNIYTAGRVLLFFCYMYASKNFEHRSLQIKK